MFECTLCGREYHDEDDVEITDDGCICNKCIELMEEEGYLEPEESEDDDFDY